MKALISIKTAMNMKFIMLTIVFFLLSSSLYSQVTGSTMSNPFDQGSFPSGDEYYFGDSNRETDGYGDDYNGEITEDVFYKFTVEGDTEINLQLYATLSVGNAYLLNENGDLIDYVYFANPYAQFNSSIPAGTYYIVVESWFWYPHNLKYTLDVVLTVS